MNRLKTNKRSFGVDCNVVIMMATVAVFTAGLSSAFAIDKTKGKKRKSGYQMKLAPERDPRKISVPSDAGKFKLPPSLQKKARALQPKVKSKYDVKGPKPVIHADEPVHDFGEVWIGPDIAHTFTITNKGDKTLNIQRVKPSCGCTIAGNYPRKIEPGETGKFPFKINSKKLHGRFEKTVTVTSDDPVTSSLRLKLRGEMKRYVDVTPSTANFGKIIKQESQERVLKITNNTKDPLEITLVLPDSAKMKYTLIEKVAGKSFELRIKAEPPFSPGRITESLKLKTNVSAQKEVNVIVRATVPERLDVQPSSITLPRTIPNSKQKDKGFTRVIRFRNYGEKPVKLLSATIDDPKVTVTVNERTAGQAYTVMIQMPAGYVPPGSGRTITLKTDDSEKPIITIPLRTPPTRTAAANRKRPAEQMVGQAVPIFTISTTEGKPLNSVEVKGNVTVLDFFAVNCGYCKKQLPRLETIRQKYESKGVRFVAMAQTMRKEYTLEETQAKMKEVGFHGELVYDPKNIIGPLFKSTSFPTMVVIGKKGKIDAVNVGNIGDLESRLTAQLDALLAGKEVPSIKTAKAPAPKRPAKKEVLGKAAPKFAAKTVEGKDISNAELANAPATILNFFAPNCGYCKKQIPRLDKIREKYESKGVRFINVSQKMRKDYSQEEVVALMKKIGFNGELVIDHSNKIGPMFGASGFPTMVVLGKSGKVEAVNVGNIGDLEQRVPAQLDALIAGKPIPSQYASKPRSANKPRRRPAEDTIGKPAPSFTLETIEGKAIASADFAKHPATVLNFVAPNCGFCKRQVPNVEKIRAEYEAKGVRFVNVIQTMRKEYPIEEIITIFKKAGSNLEMAKDKGNKVGKLYKATSFPTMIVVGKDGKIANVNIGAKANIDTLLKGQLDKLIKAKG